MHHLYQSYLPSHLEYFLFKISFLQRKRTQENSWQCLHFNFIFLLTAQDEAPSTFTAFLTLNHFASCSTNKARNSFVKLTIQSTAPFQIEDAQFVVNEVSTTVNEATIPQQDTILLLI